MKKTNLLKGALSVLAVSVLLASCTQVDSRIDTIDTLGTPSVKAVAYPGVNYISWDAVKGAKKYKVTKIVDGGIEESVNDSVTNNYVTDSIPTNDVDVEYKVYALSDNEPSSARAVYVYGSEAGSATVTNIFPPVGTEAIELPKYEKDSDWDFDEDADNSEWKDEFIPTAENIDIQYVDGTIVITAPKKAYLNTTVIGYTGNKEEIYYSDYSDNDKKEILPNYQNKKISNKKTITSAGDYKFKAEVRALGDSKKNAFYKVSNITLTKTVKVPGLLTSTATGNLKVEYIDDAKTTARVVFTPAVSKDGTTYGVENYKVYRALKDSKQLDEVTGLKADSRTTDGKTEVIYVVEDKVPSNTVDYDYYVVLNVDGSLEVGEKKCTRTKPNISAAGNGSITGLSFTEFDDDKLANDIVAKVSPYSGSKIVSVSYAFSTSDDSSKVLDSAYDHKLVVVPELAETDQAFLIKDVPENNYVFVRAEFAEIEPTGKVNSVVIGRSSNKYTVGKANEVEKITVAEPSQKKGDKDLLKNDWLNNKIALADGTSIVSVKYAFADTKELAKVAAVNGKDITMQVLDYTLGKNDDYIFDIEDAGTVGQYLGIAVEVKAEGKTNKIAVAASNNKVSVNYVNAFIGCSKTQATAETKKSTLSLDLYLNVNKDTNQVENYAGFEVSWIEAKNANYEIDPTADWTTKTYTISDLTKINDENYTVNVNTLSIPVDLAKETENESKYFVAKLVTKYTVAGAVEQNSAPGYETFTYKINK